MTVVAHLHFAAQNKTSSVQPTVLIFQHLSHLCDHVVLLGIHQVALLTHVDLVCPETAQDVTNVYKSRVVQAAIDQAAALLGMSTSYIVPVKNYSSELDVDDNTDVLLLNAVDHILQYADLYFLDNSPPPDCETP
ncbi:interferon-induced protein 44-like [Takifugu flavidus]|uniref:interferon-induced protein 44-like n=1 Tax=Takifugu flavidus TaxID=433684 RepID=UPI0025440316|nr:interferon-induced protein 44-like [Takifugu flavidus]